MLSWISRFPARDQSIEFLEEETKKNKSNNKVVSKFPLKEMMVENDKLGLTISTEADYIYFLQAGAELCQYQQSLKHASLTV